MGKVIDVKKYFRTWTECMSRGVQRTEEKLGNIQTTPIDKDVAKMMDGLDITADRTETMIKGVEKIIKPFREQSDEAYIYDTSKRYKNFERTNPCIQLGKALISHVRHVGEKSNFGKSLLLVGDCHKELGQEELNYVTKTAEVFLHPLRDFLRHDLVAAMKEKRNLQNRRLDLDAAKMRLHKAKNERQFITGEAAVRFSQVEFDRQTEITRIVLYRLERSKSEHQKSLLKLVDAHLDHHRERTSILERHRSLMTKYLSTAAPCEESSGCGYRQCSSLTDPQHVMAKVSEDYNAQRPHEVSVLLTELVKVYEENPTREDPDRWIYVEKGNGSKGYVPIIILKPMTSAGDGAATTGSFGRTTSDFTVAPCPYAP